LTKFGVVYKINEGLIEDNYMRTFTICTVHKLFLWIF